MRTFVAVFLPSEVSSALSTAIRDLDVGDEVRWVPSANVHLTLKFLGNVAVEDLQHVKLALDTVATRYAPFEATPSEFGAFPNGRRAKILWAGVGEGSERLRALAHEVEDRLAPLGFERERRPFVPHLTLGRARRRPVRFDQTGVRAPDRRFAVSGIQLVQSVTGASGPTYPILATYTLSGPQIASPSR